MELHSNNAVLNLPDNTWENFGFGIFRTDVEGRIVHCNRPFLRLLGFSSFSELQEHYSKEEYAFSAAATKRFYSYLNDPKSVSNENLWQKKNGRKILLREFVSGIENEEGKILGFDCIVEDISEKNLIENIFKDIKSSDYSILKAIPDLIFVLSKEGDIIDCKNNYRNLFGTTLKLKGNSIFSVFSEELANIISAKIHSTLNSGDYQILEFQREKDFQTQFFEARFAIRTHEEVVMILRDVTEQKNAEQQIKKFTEELKQLNTTKDKLFSIIGHDLRTPLNGLLGYAEILSNEINELSGEEIQKFAEYIFEIAQSVNILLNNLLKWSRIQSGTIPFEPRNLILSKPLEKILRLLQASADNKKINLINEVNKRIEIIADENMLQSVFLNLIGNAIKFTNKGGTVKISSQEFDDQIKISVSDNGVGISQENLNKLFDPTKNFSTLGTSKEKGTGLGLILCYEFVKKHRGKIWAESTAGKGTTISFTILKKVSANFSRPDFN